MRPERGWGRSSFDTRETSCASAQRGRWSSANITLWTPTSASTRSGAATIRCPLRATADNETCGRLCLGGPGSAGLDAAAGLRCRQCRCLCRPLPHHPGESRFGNAPSNVVAAPPSARAQSPRDPQLHLATLVAQYPEDGPRNRTRSKSRCQFRQTTTDLGFYLNNPSAPSMCNSADLNLDAQPRPHDRFA